MRRTKTHTASRLFHKTCFKDLCSEHNSKNKTKSLKQYVVYVYPVMFDITKLLTSEIVHSALLSITENLTEFQVLNTA